MADRKRDRPTWVRFSGLGFEFGAALVGFTLVGIWIDRSYGTSPKGALIGAALGIIGGGYNFLRSSLAALREVERKESESNGDESDV